MNNKTMNNKTYLKCPNCRDCDTFNPFSVGKIIEQTLDLSFHDLPIIYERKVVLICTNCGFTIKDAEQLKARIFVILTGSSVVYKRQATVTAGFRKALEQTPGIWAKYMYVEENGVLLITKEAYKDPTPEIEAILKDCATQVCDVSDGNYSELLEIVAKSRRKP